MLDRPDEPQLVVRTERVCFPIAHVQRVGSVLEESAGVEVKSGKNLGRCKWGVECDHGGDRASNGPRLRVRVAIGGRWSQRERTRCEKR